MITTNVTGGGHFFVHTDDPSGEWSTPIWLEGKGIDPSLFFDEDGKVYFTYTAGKIVQREMDIATGQVGEERPIWGGTGGQFPEGPHLYKINGMYYLLISEGGTEYGHMLTLARANSPWGPFESCPHNPILSHRSQLSPIQATGHGDLVQDAQGGWWMVFLGIRPNGHWPYHHLGRETFLAPISWNEQGWPVVGADGRVALEMEAPELPAPQPWPDEPGRDSFDDLALGLAWNFLRSAEAVQWSLTERPGFLRLYGSALSLDDVGALAWVGRRQEHFDLRAALRLEFQPQAENEAAGLCVWMNERHHYELLLTLRSGQRCVIVRRRIGSLVAEVACQPVADGALILSVKAERSEYIFSAAVEGALEVELARGETRYVATEVAGGFTGVYLAMVASGHGQPCAAPADFDWFDYLPQ
jgi:alpha-N-arabinofuranosidase